MNKREQRVFVARYRAGQKAREVKAGVGLAMMLAETLTQRRVENMRARAAAFRESQVPEEDKWMWKVVGLLAAVGVLGAVMVGRWF